MPSIIIRERDLTSAGNPEVTSNAVYIPGYAVMGPVNTPTLCESLEDFKAIFGSTPYRFREDHKWSTLTDFDSSAVSPTMGLFAQRGEYEKSYIMACEYLRLGLPVLFERVFSPGHVVYITTRNMLVDPTRYSDEITVTNSEIYKGETKLADLLYETTLNHARWCATHKDSHGNVFVSTTPGMVSTCLRSYIRKEQLTESSCYYILSVERVVDNKLGTASVAPVETRFTFDSDVARQYSNIKLISQGSNFIDNSGLVTVYVQGEAFDFVTLDAETKKYPLTSFEFNSDIKIDNKPLRDVAQTVDEFKIADMYTYLSTNDEDTNGNACGFNRLLDKGEYVIKFITSGAYPVFEYKNNSISEVMLNVAATRGDVTAIVDHTPNNTRALGKLDSSSVYYKVADWAKTSRINHLGEDSNVYGTMFTPYGIYNCLDVSRDVMLPASFGYLVSYAAQLQSFNGWLATAGVTRGLVPNLKSLCQNITNAIADSYLPRDGVAINPITNIKPYGLTMWGARTLKNNALKGDLTATSFLNIRQMTNDVKRTTWVSAKILTYEQNSDMLWIKFKMNITPLLDQMVSAGAISAYSFKRVPTTKKATVQATIRMYPVEPVEDWDITVELADESTQVIG